MNRAWTFADRRDLPAGRVLARFAATNAVAFAVSEAVVLAGDALVPRRVRPPRCTRVLTLNAIEVPPSPPPSA